MTIFLCAGVPNHSLFTGKVNMVQKSFVYVHWEILGTSLEFESGSALFLSFDAAKQFTHRLNELCSQAGYRLITNLFTLSEIE